MYFTGKPWQRVPEADRVPVAVAGEGLLRTLRAGWDWPIITAEFVAFLLGVSQQRAREVLRRAWDSGYLLRQRFRVAGGGTMPRLYVLSSRGADVLRQTDDVILGVHYSEPGAVSDPRRLIHDLVALRLAVALAQAWGVGPEALQGPRRSRYVYQRGGGKSSAQVVPDMVVYLGGQAVMVEYERSVDPRGLARKTINYQALAGGAAWVACGFSAPPAVLMIGHGADGPVREGSGHRQQRDRLDDLLGAAVQMAPAQAAVAVVEEVLAGTGRVYLPGREPVGFSDWPIDSMQSAGLV